MVHSGLENQLRSDYPQLQACQAILLVQDKYVLHLRDDKPEIIAAGKWSLIGGQMEKDETPLQAIKREVMEELSVAIPEFQFLWFTDYTVYVEKLPARSWFFVADMGLMWGNHKLTEGKAVKCFKYEEISDLEMSPVIRDSVVRFHQQVNGN